MFGQGALSSRAFIPVYPLIKNTFGLGVHPFKTLWVIDREKDRSQQLLILGLPAYVLVAGTGVVWLGRRLLGTSEEWGWGAKGIALMVVVATLSLGVYLAYWLVKVWQTEKRQHG